MLILRIVFEGHVHQVLYFTQRWQLGRLQRQPATIQVGNQMVPKNSTTTLIETQWKLTVLELLHIVRRKIVLT